MCKQKLHFFVFTRVWFLPLFIMEMIVITSSNFLKLLSHNCDNRVYGANFQETFRRREEIIGLELCRINRKVLSSPRQTSSIASKCRGLVSGSRRKRRGTGWTGVGHRSGS